MRYFKHRDFWFKSVDGIPYCILLNLVGEIYVLYTDNVFKQIDLMDKADLELYVAEGKWVEVSEKEWAAFVKGYELGADDEALGLS